MRFDITYEIITPESAEDGEAWETGFHDESITLRDAYNFLRWEGYCEANEFPVRNPDWLTFHGEQSYVDCSQTNYSLHFPRHMTKSSKLRVARLFGCVK